MFCPGKQYFKIPVKPLIPSKSVLARDLIHVNTRSVDKIRLFYIPPYFSGKENTMNS